MKIREILTDARKLMELQEIKNELIRFNEREEL